jgi:heme/copper-type cytochrome/quinol oxidase subunit 3
MKMTILSLRVVYALALALLEATPMLMDKSDSAELAKKDVKPAQTAQLATLALLVSSTKTKCARLALKNAKPALELKLATHANKLISCCRSPKDALTLA